MTKGCEHWRDYVDDGGEYCRKYKKDCLCMGELEHCDYKGFSSYQAWRRKQWTEVYKIYGEK